MKKIITTVVLIQTLMLSGGAIADTSSYGFKSRFIFDYRDYGRPSNVIQKTFSTDDPACGQTEIRNYADTVVGDNTEVRVRRIRRDIYGAVCQNRVFNYLKTPRERLLLSKENWNLSGTSLNSTDVIDSPVVTHTSAMLKGRTFGSASSVTRTTAVSATAVGAVIDTHVALELEDISVPYGSFTGCLKVTTSRDSVVFGGSFNRISWFCNGVGEVQRIQGNAGITKIWRLTNVVAN